MYSKSFRQVRSRARGRGRVRVTPTQKLFMAAAMRQAGQHPIRPRHQISRGKRWGTRRRRALGKRSLCKIGSPAWVRRCTSSLATTWSGTSRMKNALPAALGGNRFEFASPAGRLSVYVQGQGAPLLLIHRINAAASAAEVRPIHEHYLATRTVFSVDRPGYGFSDRSDRDCTPRLMTDAVHAVTAHIAVRCGPAPIDALAVSLSCG
jgi:hypothetical protein